MPAAVPQEKVPGWNFLRALSSILFIPRSQHTVHCGLRNGRDGGLFIAAAQAFKVVVERLGPALVNPLVTVQDTVDGADLSGVAVQDVYKRQALRHSWGGTDCRTPIQDT